MKRNILILEFVTGMIFFLGGFLIYGLGVHEIFPVPRPDLVLVGTTIIGILLILCGSEFFAKKTKEMEIAEKDERNIAIANASMASGFKVITALLAFVLLALIFTGYMNEVSCFSMIGVFVIGEITYLFKLYYLNKHM